VLTSSSELKNDASSLPPALLLFSIHSKVKLDQGVDSKKREMASMWQNLSKLNRRVKCNVGQVRHPSVKDTKYSRATTHRHGHRQNPL